MCYTSNFQQADTSVTAFRHEWKHEINYGDMLTLRQRLKAVACPDEHAVNGAYEIRSLYFDSPEDKALREKLDGVNIREKFRIRFYNGDTSFIHLEKKGKRGALSHKTSALLTREEAFALSHGITDWMSGHADPLVHELYLKMCTEGLRAKTIVDYTREAYLYPAGNVRVTMDYNIHTGLSYTDFLDMECPMIPVENSPVILEVKWDALLPDIIYDIIQLKNRRSSAFSKYAACRAYD